MSEYTLVKDISSYTYPSHMKRPDGFFGSNFFEKWIPNWTKYLGSLSGKPRIKGIEIGCLHGDCSVFCAEKIVSGEGSIHYSIDINTNEYLENNLAPYVNKNVRFIQGNSRNVLRRNFEDDTIDYIYIDGSHLAVDVISDAVLSWPLLKNEGILIFDDYGWGIHTTIETEKPKLAIDSFLNTYKGYYSIIEFGWQVFMKKIPHIYSEEEKDANYMK